MRNLCGFIFVVSIPLLAACEGVPGVQGPTGPSGPAGDPGATGDAGTNGNPGQTGTPGCNAAASGVGLDAKLTVGAPSNGSFYAEGERITATLKITDACGTIIPVA